MRPEDNLQKAVVDYLELIEAREPGFVFFAVPNAGKRSFKGAAREKAMGLRSGVPDLCIIFGGRPHFIELKAPGSLIGKRGKPKADPRSVSQKHFQWRLIAAGSAVTTRDSFESVREFIDLIVAASHSLKRQKAEAA